MPVGKDHFLPRNVPAYGATPPTPNHDIRLVLGYHRTIEDQAVFERMLSEFKRQVRH